MARRSTLEDFWRRVDKRAHPKGCWLWRGSKGTNGYGVLSFAEVMGNSAQTSPHRISWILATDLVPPKDWHLHHTCRNKLCVNPDHLEMVTAARHRVIHQADRRKPWHMATPYVR